MLFRFKERKTLILFFSLEYELVFSKNSFFKTEFFGHILYFRYWYKT